MDKIKEGDSCRCNELEGRILKLEIAKNSTDDYKARVGAKLDRIEANHQEIMQQQTKLSGSLTLVTTVVEMQQKDREVKHKELMSLIEGIYTTFNKHTDDEMARYDAIKEVQDDTKWKTKVMWAVMVSAGSGVLGLVFWLVREFIQKGF